MKHVSGKPLCKIYCKTGFKDVTAQGPIINFNLLRTNGTFIGYSEVEKMASLYNIHLRTGCFCNIGACKEFLNLSNEQIKKNLSAGHVCGDNVDLIDGKPTGSVRISFGYMSNFDDAKTFLRFLVECFLEQASNVVSAVGRCDISSGVDQSRHFRSEETEDLTLMSPSRNLLQIQHQSNDTGSNFCQECDNRPSNLLSDLATKPFVNGDSKTDLSELRKNNSSLLYCGLRLEQICLYPIKSCAAFKVDEWEVGDRGFVYDRQWMIISDSGICLTQKQEPQLCLIKPKVDLANGVLMVTAPGLSKLVVPLSLSSTKKMGKNEASLCHSKVCGDKISAMDCGEEAACWVSEFLNRKCRLIQHHKQDGRISKLGEPKEGNSGTHSWLSLANESQFLLITRSSSIEILINSTQAALVSKDTAGNENDDNMINRFRANLIVNGGKPFMEDEWKNIEIGNFTFKSQGKCNRCQMVCVDQDTGMRSIEPLKTLGKLRGSRMPFGIYLQHEVNNSGTQPVILHCGDEVRVFKE